MSHRDGVKSVRFNDHVDVYTYFLYQPCWQEFVALWNECKRFHLQNEYKRKHGSLYGFDYDYECLLSDRADVDFELLDGGRFSPRGD